ncbi:MAG: ComEC/Rec2 family competence protein, partial [Eubacteriales bacterium]
MRTVPKRPLLGICTVFFGGLVLFFCASAVSVPVLLICMAGVVLFLLLAFLPRIPLQRAFCILSAAALLLAFFLTQKTLADYRSFRTEDIRIAALTGVVRQLSYANDSGAAFLLDVDTMDGTRVSGKVSVISQGEHVYYADVGERVSFHALLGDEALMQDYETYAQSNFADGIYASVRLIDDGAFQIIGKKQGFTVLCADIAAFCRQKLYVYLPQDAAALVTGILIGDKSALSASVIRDFRRVGISHVLAVSGLHVSVLLGGMLRFMTALGVGKRTRLILTAGFLVLFMGITGFSPSVTRAGLMWLLCGISFFAGGRADSLTSLFSAAAIICAVSPTSVFDIGLILSVSASCGILVLTPPLDAYLAKALPSKRMVSRIFRLLPSLCGVTLA